MERAYVVLLALASISPAAETSDPKSPCHAAQSMNDCAILMNNLGSVYFARGKYRDAELMFARAIGLWAAEPAPSLDLAACADAIAEPRNFLYERHFVRGLKSRMRYKAKLFPGQFPLDGLDRVRTVREFDDVITARFCGFRSAADYYAQSSASRAIAGIRRPTFILTAQDDPVVPFASFEKPAIRENPIITFLAPRYGGHCAFISAAGGDARFWAEARIVEFCQSQSSLGT